MEGEGQSTREMRATQRGVRSSEMENEGEITRRRGQKTKRAQREGRKKGGLTVR